MGRFTELKHWPGTNPEHPSYIYVGDPSILSNMQSWVLESYTDQADFIKLEDGLIVKFKERGQCLTMFMLRWS